MRIKSVKITNFQYWDKLELTNLKKLNIIIGEINTRKNAILKVIYYGLSQNHHIDQFLKQFEEKLDVFATCNLNRTIGTIELLDGTIGIL